MGMFPHAPAIKFSLDHAHKRIINLNHWSLSYIYYNTVSTLDPGEVIYIGCEGAHK